MFECYIHFEVSIVIIWSEEITHMFTDNNQKQYYIVIKEKILKSIDIYDCV